MQNVQLHALPELNDDPWTMEYFSERTEAICRSAATDLHRKSLMVEEAVEEILQLVRNSQQNLECPDDFEFVIEGIVFFF